MDLTFKSILPDGRLKQSLYTVKEMCVTIPWITVIKEKVRLVKLQCIQFEVNINKVLDVSIWKSPLRAESESNEGKDDCLTRLAWAFPLQCVCDLCPLTIGWHNRKPWWQHPFPIDQGDGEESWWFYCCKTCCRGPSQHMFQPLFWLPVLCSKTKSFW